MANTRKRTRKNSDHKENRPKKVKVKPDPKDGIALSRQLLRKKKTLDNNRRITRQNNSSNRHCPNGKLMPSLADLEKMFEDTDSENDIISIKTCSEKEVNTVTTPTPTPDSIPPDSLFTPTTPTKIISQVQEILSNDTYHSELSDIPLQPTTEEHKKNCHPFFSAIEEMPLNSITSHNELVLNRSHLSEVIKPVVNDCIVSDNSSDSNKTVEYQLTASQVFCPMPSTSKDHETFFKNDELFNKSLEDNHTCSKQNSFETLETVNNDSLIKPKNEDEDILIQENPTETIIIDDEIKIEEPQKNIDIKSNQEIQIIDCTDLNIPNKISGNNYIEPLHVDDDDDDCVLVETETEPQKKELNETKIIDIEYAFHESFINDKNDKGAEKMDVDDIIDVDALISQNQSILDKFKKSDSKPLNSSNLVVDVDLSSNSCNSNNSSKAQVVNNQPTPEVITVGQTNLVVDVDLSSNSCNSNNSPGVQVVSNQPTPEVIPVGHTNNLPAVERHMPIILIAPTGSIPPEDIIHISESKRQEVLEKIRRIPLLQRLTNHLYKPNLIHRNIPAHNDSHSDIVDNSNEVSNLVINSSSHESPSQFLGGGEQNPHTPSSLQSQKSKSKKKKKANNTPTAIASQSIPTSSPVSVKLDCPICMDTFAGKDVVSTMCGHLYCKRCLETSLATNKRCPTCRKILKKNGYHQIFL